MITEYSITLNLALPPKDVHKKMEVFYNPVMASHRNIALLFLNSIPTTVMNIADPLAGSGIRSLRFIKELKKGKMKHLFVNDVKENFTEVFQKNARLNKIKNNHLSVFNEDASLFLMNRIKDKHKPEHFCGYFDYIDIDPFGSPNPFLMAAIARISRKGIIAATATDTAALTGTYPLVTRRKYWATPLRNYLMHEVGLRILIRKIQLQGMQFEKALIPLLSYHKDHYFRVYLQSFTSRKLCDELAQQHRYFLFCPACLNFKTSLFNNENCSCGAGFEFAGPLWTGKLIEQKLITTMINTNSFPEEQAFLRCLQEEASFQSMGLSMGFYDLHEIAHKYKIAIPKIEMVLKSLAGTRTQFSSSGVKSGKGIKEIVEIIKNALATKKK